VCHRKSETYVIHGVPEREVHYVSLQMHL